MGWLTLVGVALVVFGAVLLALVDAPRRAIWQLTQRFGRARRQRPHVAGPEAPGPAPSGLWVAGDDTGGPQDRGEESTLRL